MRIHARKKGQIHTMGVVGEIARTNPEVVFPTRRLVFSNHRVVKPTPGLVKPTPGLVKPTPGVAKPTPGVAKPTPGLVTAIRRDVFGSSDISSDERKNI